MDFKAFTKWTHGLSFPPMKIKINVCCKNGN